MGLGVNQTPLTNPTTLHTGLRLPKADSHQQQHQSRQQHQPQQQHQQQQLHKSQQQQQHSVQRARIGQYADVMPSTANAGTTNAGSQAGGKQATAQHSDVTAQHGKSLAQHGNSSAQRGEVTADSFLALCVETASKSPSVSPNRRQLHRRRITELPKQAGPVFASAHTKGLESNEKRQGRVCQKQHGGKSGRAGSKSVIREQSERPAVSGACSTGEAVSPSAASQPAAALHVKTHADAAQHDTAQRDTVQCDTAQSDIPQRDTPQRDMAQKATPVHNHRHEQHSMPQKVKAQPAASFSGRTPSHAKLAKQDRPGLPCPRKVLGVQQGRSNASAQQQSPESQHMLDRADDLQSQLAETSQQQSSGIVADSGVLSGSPQGPHAPQQMSSGHGPLHLTQASLLLEPNQASPPSEPKQASPHLVPNQASSQEPPLVGRHLQTRASPVQSKLSTVLPTGLVAMQQSTVAADALQSVRQQPVQQQQPKSKRSKRVGRKRCHSQKGKGRADDAAASSAVANIGRVLEMAPDVRAQDSGSADTESAGPVGVGTAPAVFDKNAKTQKAVVGKRTHREVNVVDTHLEHSSKRHVRSRQGDQKPWWVV